MKTNTKEIKEKIRMHILESVQDYEENYFKTAQEAATHLFNEFIRVERLDNFKNFYSYIFGVPFDFYFWDDDIIDFLNGLGINPTNKEFSKQESRNLYVHLIYREVKNLNK